MKLRHLISLTLCGLAGLFLAAARPASASAEPVISLTPAGPGTRALSEEAAAAGRNGAPVVFVYTPGTHAPSGGSFTAARPAKASVAVTAAPAAGPLVTAALPGWVRPATESAAQCGAAGLLYWLTRGGRRGRRGGSRRRVRRW